MAQYIANPIYDSAFKYMMQNEKSATLLLSALLQRKITDLKIIANDTPVIEERKSLCILSRFTFWDIRFKKSKSKSRSFIITPILRESKTSRFQML